MMGFWQRNAFVLALPVVVALAWVFPESGARGGWLRSEITTQVCVVVIFFLQGLVLPTAGLRQSLFHWRLHGLVQGFIFVGFPLIGLGFDAWWGGRLPADLRLGLLFLCVLPSTISTSIVLTAVAHGHTAAAIFNAVLSNVLGIVLTPLWIAWVMRSGGVGVPVGELVLEIAWLLLVPLACGQLMRRRRVIRVGAEQNRGRLGHVSSGLILFIVYAAFANSVQARTWEQQGSELTVIGLGIVTLFLALAWMFVRMLARLMRLRRPDAIVAVFCGAQKSLATGVPLAQVIFGDHPGMGLILLPIMLYHPLQLFVFGLAAGRWSRLPVEDPRSS